MVKLYKESKIEIWCAKYINDYCNKTRDEDDKNLKVVQIETGDNGDYIVEVVPDLDSLSFMEASSQVLV